MDMWRFTTRWGKSRARLIGLAALGMAAAGAIQGQWGMQTSNTTADLRGIHTVGGGVAWASGTNGTVLRTEDGGYVWQGCSMPPGAEKLDFRGVQGFDADTAIVMSSGKGELSRLYKTTDGCHTWKLLFTNPDAEGFWDAIRFANREVGALAGDAVNGELSIRVTQDGGQTWKPLVDDALKAGGPNDGMFAASNSTLQVLRGGEVILAAANVKQTAAFYQAKRGNFCHGSGAAVGCFEGYTWSAARLPVTGGKDSGGVYSLGLRQDASGAIERMVVVGGDYTQPEESAGTAAFSVDSGKNWTVAKTPPHGYRSSVAYDEGLKVWISVGPNGTDVSNDDGKTWRAVHPNAGLHEAADADRNWNALSLPYVVGPKGRIGRLEDAAVGH